ncbi:MAG: hypothetical protein ACRDXX_00070 [Stackebrandtia sp.]
MTINLPSQHGLTMALTGYGENSNFSVLGDSAHADLARRRAAALTDKIVALAAQGCSGT